MKTEEKKSKYDADFPDLKKPEKSEPISLEKVEKIEKPSEKPSKPESKNDTVSMEEIMTELMNFKLEYNSQANQLVSKI